MCDEEHGLAGRGESVLDAVVEDIAANTGIDGAQRIVEHHHVPVSIHRPRQCNTRLLAPASFIIVKSGNEKEDVEKRS